MNVANPLLRLNVVFQEDDSCRDLGRKYAEWMSWRMTTQTQRLVQRTFEVQRQGSFTEATGNSVAGSVNSRD